ncbi:MAG: glycyl-radical enzyme activating protein, partial [Desulfobacterales bacterium]|nr:glycyl-radical enzyme activating protein [Desulfobacterales bacterium]
PHLDQIYFDIKPMDPSLHKEYCGLANGQILENFTQLQAAWQQGGVPILPRTPVVPGITDTRENLKAMARFLNGLGVDRAQLIPYHPLWQEKNRKIGRPPSLEGMDEWMSLDRVKRCQGILLEHGIAPVD